MARMFVSDARSCDDGCELLATVMIGEVGVGDRVEPADGEVALPVVRVAHACKSCSFGERLQEGDRGVVVVAGDVGRAPVGRLVEVVGGK